METINNSGDRRSPSRNKSVVKSIKLSLFVAILILASQSTQSLQNEENSRKANKWQRLLQPQGSKPPTKPKGKTIRPRIRQGKIKIDPNDPTNPFRIQKNRTNGFIFGDPISSNLTSSGFPGQGPLNKVFAVCSNSSTCRMVNRRPESIKRSKNGSLVFWKTDSAASPHIFSSQISQKTLITGFPTRILEFGFFNNKLIFKQQQTYPQVIIHCVYTRGTNWICVSGSGHYFLYNIEDGMAVKTYSKARKELLGRVDNHNCATMEDDYLLVCVNLEFRNRVLVMNLRDSEADFVGYMDWFRTRHPELFDESSGAGKGNEDASGAVGVKVGSAVKGKSVGGGGNLSRTMRMRWAKGDRKGKKKRKRRGAVGKKKGGKKTQKKKNRGRKKKGSQSQGKGQGKKRERIGKKNQKDKKKKRKKKNNKRKKKNRKRKKKNKSRKGLRIRLKGGRTVKVSTKRTTKNLKINQPPRRKTRKIFRTANGSQTLSQSNPQKSKTKGKTTKSSAKTDPVSNQNNKKINKLRLKYPPKPTGISTYKDIVSIYSVTRTGIQVTVSNFTTGELIIKWSSRRFLDANPKQSVANVKTGALLVTTKNFINILNLRSGALLRQYNISAWRVTLGESNGWVYFTERDTRIFKIIEIQNWQYLSKESLKSKYEGEDGCLDYLYPFQSCLECDTKKKYILKDYLSQKVNRPRVLRNYTLQKNCEEYRPPRVPPAPPQKPPNPSNPTPKPSIDINGPPVHPTPDTSPDLNNNTNPSAEPPKPNGNNIPGLDLSKLIYLPSDKYSVDLMRLELDQVTVRFSSLKKVSMEEREAYVRNMIRNRKKYLKFIVVNLDDENWRQDLALRVDPVLAPGMWRAGVMPLRISPKMTQKRFRGEFRVVAPDYISQTSENRVNEASGGDGDGFSVAKGRGGSKSWFGGFSRRRLLERQQVKAIEPEIVTKSQNEAEGGPNQSPNPTKKAPVLDPTPLVKDEKGIPQAAKSGKNDQKGQKNSHQVLFPAYFKPPNWVLQVARTVFGISKIIVLILQFLLIFVRPFLPWTYAHLQPKQTQNRDLSLSAENHPKINTNKANSNKIDNKDNRNDQNSANLDRPNSNSLKNPELIKNAKNRTKKALFAISDREEIKPVPDSLWQIWFGSTITSIQILLIMGTITGVYGGFLDAVMAEAFQQFRSYFFVLKPQFKIFENYTLLTQSGARIPKLDSVGFFYSPFQENLIEILIFLVSFFFDFLATGLFCEGLAIKEILRAMRLGASVSFMVPLVLSSSACLYKIGSIYFLGSGFIFSVPKPEGLLEGAKGVGGGGSRLLESSSTLFGGEKSWKKLKMPKNPYIPPKSSVGPVGGAGAKQATLTASFGRFGWLSVLTSSFIIIYYTSIILTEILTKTPKFRPKRNPNAHRSIQRQQNTPKIIKEDQEFSENPNTQNPQNRPKMALRRWSYLAFDTDDLSWFTNTNLFNFAEILIAFFTPLVVSVSGNQFAVGSFVLFYLFSINFCMDNGKLSNQQESIKREKYRIQEILDKKRKARFKASQSSHGLAWNDPRVPKHLRIKPIGSGGGQEDDLSLYELNPVEIGIKRVDFGERMTNLLTLKFLDNGLKMMAMGVFVTIWVLRESRGLLVTVILSIIGLIFVILDLFFIMSILIIRVFGDGDAISIITPDQVKALRAPIIPKTSQTQNFQKRFEKYTKRASSHPSRSLGSPKRQLRKQKDKESDWDFPSSIPNEYRESDSIIKTEEKKVAKAGDSTGKALGKEKNRFGGFKERLEQGGEEVDGAPLSTERRGILNSEARGGNFGDDGGSGDEIESLGGEDVVVCRGEFIGTIEEDQEEVCEGLEYIVPEESAWYNAE